MNINAALPVWSRCAQTKQKSKYEVIDPMKRLILLLFAIVTLTACQYKHHCNPNKVRHLGFYDNDINTYPPKKSRYIRKYTIEIDIDYLVFIKPSFNFDLYVMRPQIVLES
jgi:hypothetical protein